MKETRLLLNHWRLHWMTSNAVANLVTALEVSEEIFSLEIDVEEEDDSIVDCHICELTNNKG
jgi:hypothetical protein